MEPFGVGTEIVETVRIARLVDRQGEAFLRRVFTPREILCCHGQSVASSECFAGLWAAKVAALRSIGRQRPDYPSDWLNLEIDLNSHGKPQLRVGGRCKSWLIELRIAEVLLSIAHCRGYATATAIALRRGT